MRFPQYGNEPISIALDSRAIGLVDLEINRRVWIYQSDVTRGVSLRDPMPDFGLQYFQNY